MAGPAMVATPWLTRRTPLACCGSVATWGTRLVRPGWNIAVASPPSTDARTSSHSAGWPSQRQSASPAWIAQRAPSAAIICGRGWKRSANTPPNTTNRANAPIQAPSATPTAPTPKPSESIATAVATGIMVSPSTAMVRAVK